MQIKIIIGCSALFILGACTNFNSRTANRAATGATIGAIGAAIVSGNPLRGAVVGGAVGAITSQNRLVWE